MSVLWINIAYSAMQSVCLDETHGLGNFRGNSPVAVALVN